MRFTTVFVGGKTQGGPACKSEKIKVEEGEGEPIQDLHFGLFVRRQESIAYEIYRGNRYLLQFWLSDLHMKNGTKICDTKPEVKINRIPLHGIDIAHKLHVLLGGDMLSSVG